MQHGINGRREESQISEPGDATIREKAPNPFYLIRREAVSFANLKTFVPDSPFGRSLFRHSFSLRSDEERRAALNLEINIGLSYV